MTHSDTQGENGSTVEAASGLPQKEPRNVHMNVRTTQKVMTRLLGIATEEDRSLSHVAHRILAEYVKQEERQGRRDVEGQDAPG